MLRVFLSLKATNDIPKSGWKKGETLEMTVEVFNKQNGLAYHFLDPNWEILRMEVVDYEPIDTRI